MIFSNRSNWLRRLQTILRLFPVLLLAACSQQGGYGGRVEIGADGWRRPTHYYPPPGPPEDPWGPYIREAAGRYRVPERWVRAVMQQESGGQEQATSPVGAMGLMQVMPATYEELRVRHRLGDDPYEPHNNILAGTAYIREMYDRFGAPGFLAAYNAGPDRLESYLAGRSRLPSETMNYVAAIAPNLGGGVRLSGPLKKYASARSGRGTRPAPSIMSLAAGCDLNAAYDPKHPCTTLERDAVQPTAIQTAYAAGVGGCDLNAAYDPNHPCISGQRVAASSAPARPALVQQAAAPGCGADAAYSPNRPCTPAAQPPASGVQLASVTTRQIPVEKSAIPPRPTAPKPEPTPSRSAPSGGSWAIQVGAFKSQHLAREMAEGARAQAPDQLRSATLTLPPTAPFGGTILYRARLVHLSASAASSACTHLNRRQLPCVVVPPRDS